MNLGPFTPQLDVLTTRPLRPDVFSNWAAHSVEIGWEKFSTRNCAFGMFCEFLLNKLTMKVSDWIASRIVNFSRIDTETWTVDDKVSAESRR